MKLPESVLSKMPGGGKNPKGFAPMAVLLVLATSIAGVLWGWFTFGNKDSASVTHCDPSKLLWFDKEQGCTACGMG